MKNFDWYRGIKIMDALIGIFFLFIALIGFFGFIIYLSNIDVNAPPSQACINGIAYFTDTLTPVYDKNSLNPQTCKH